VATFNGKLAVALENQISKMPEVLVSWCTAILQCY
jgi:hypothetical protein